MQGTPISVPALCGVVPAPLMPVVGPLCGDDNIRIICGRKSGAQREQWQIGNGNAGERPVDVKGDLPTASRQQCSGGEAMFPATCLDPLRLLDCSSRIGLSSFSALDYSSAAVIESYGVMERTPCTSFNLRATISRSKAWRSFAMDAHLAPTCGQED
jgi:hypothetical protein